MTIETPEPITIASSHRRELEVGIRAAMLRNLPKNHPTVVEFWATRPTLKDEQILNIAKVHGVSV